MANILIIDDDQLIRNTLARHTEDMGHKAVVAETLSEGIDKASWQLFRHNYDANFQTGPHLYSEF